MFLCSVPRKGTSLPGVHWSLVALTPRASADSGLELLLSPHTPSVVHCTDWHLVLSSVAVPMFKTQSKYFHVGWWMTTVSSQSSLPQNKNPLTFNNSGDFSWGKGMLMKIGRRLREKSLMFSWNFIWRGRVNSFWPNSWWSELYVLVHISYFITWLMNANNI